jgi:thiamine-monophosphate kinase
VSIGEFELIDRYFGKGSASAAAAVAPGVVLGIGDDAALLQVPEGHDLVAAVDTIVAGRHFPDGTEARAIGHRALAVNLSDFAAMGATPAWATLALTIPAADPAWLAAFADGLLTLAARHGVALVGGDTTCGPLTVSIQLLGFTPHGTALRRAGAKRGDLLVVTGSLGDAGAGLWLAQTRASGPTPDGARLDFAAPNVVNLLRRFEYPAPRVEFGLAARGIASAAMDLSDGLLGDLPKLAGASRLRAHVDLERLPLSPALRAMATSDRARNWALAAGDDYELLLAVAPDRLLALTDAAERCGLALTEIGRLGDGVGVEWRSGGRAFTPDLRGYDHFR